MTLLEIPAISWRCLLTSSLLLPAISACEAPAADGRTASQLKYRETVIECQHNPAHGLAEEDNLHNVDKHTWATLYRTCGEDYYLSLAAQNKLFDSKKNPITAEEGFRACVRMNGSGVRADGSFVQWSTVHHKVEDREMITTAHNQEAIEKFTLACDPVNDHRWVYSPELNTCFRCDDRGSAINGLCRFDMFAGSGVNYTEMGLANVPVPSWYTQMASMRTYADPLGGSAIGSSHMVVFIDSHHWDAQECQRQGELYKSGTQLSTTPRLADGGVQGQSGTDEIIAVEEPISEARTQQAGSETKEESISVHLTEVRTHLETKKECLVIKETQNTKPEDRRFTISYDLENEHCKPGRLDDIEAPEESTGDEHGDGINEIECYAIYSNGSAFFANVNGESMQQDRKLGECRLPSIPFNILLADDGDERELRLTVRRKDGQTLTGAWQYDFGTRTWK